ncbi:MAG: Rrf2 family transcriptional regulator [bacterium]|nr:Rrf2 family transcriptional regulator [bacterium]
MRVTKSEEYGLRLVMSLALEKTQLSIRELADRETLPEPTVAKVISRLRHTGVVTSERGRNGGYTLADSADQINLAQIVEAFSDPLYDRSFCDRVTPNDEPCAHDSECGLRPVWRGLADLVADFLSGITVADIIQKSSSPAMYPTTQPIPLDLGTNRSDA